MCLILSVKSHLSFDSLWPTASRSSFYLLTLTLYSFTEGSAAPKSRILSMPVEECLPPPAPHWVPLARVQLQLGWVSRRTGQRPQKEESAHPHRVRVHTSPHGHFRGALFISFYIALFSLGSGSVDNYIFHFFTRILEHSKD